jgi:D-alanyl-D-alanine carboxypeptidase/D-alanyl-D-alanine-endopeptidase (penicillin-binding protein 4)
MQKLFLFIFLFLETTLFGQAALNKALSKFINDSDLATAGISVTVMDVQTGQLIASHQADKSLIPASSMKIVTTGAALGMLSPDYVFKTEVQYDGAFNLQTGVLDGNIYLKGYGDPTLGSADLMTIPDLNTVMNQFADAIDNAGICKINGRVIGDGTFFQGIDGVGLNWQWDDIGNYYGAGAYGLNIHENYYFLNLQQVPILGSQPKILGTKPYVPEITFSNKLTSAASGTGDNSYIFTAPYSDESLIRGTIPIGNNTFKVKGSMPDPVLTAAYYLHQQLKENYRVTIRKSPTNIEDVNIPILPKKTIYTYYSPKMSVIVDRTNMESVNLYAESLLRLLGQVQSSTGTPSAGIDAVKKYYEAKGVKLDGFFMEDGSGLSSKNAVSSRHLAAIMRVIANDNTINTAFYNSLPKAGESGTLKNMFKGTKAVGNLRAKSGSMTRVRSYTGYATRPNGKQWSFSVIVNNYNCSGGEMRRKLQDLMESMCE